MKDWKILEIDPWIKDYKSDIDLRMEEFKKQKSKLLKKGEKLKDFANAHNYYGIHKTRTGWVYREWAPNAKGLYLIGDFNNWDRHSHPLEKINNEDWEINIKGIRTIPHKSRIKVMIDYGDRTQDRIPLYARRVERDENLDFSAVVLNPRKKFEWTDEKFKTKKDNLLIYETHIGMAQEKEGIGTYKEFEKNILPRIKDEGYNTVQFMAIAEHPYYGSFGYQVSNFFSPSSWYGENDELKSLINKAHEMGLNVIMDLVHSHAVKNTNEGINEFDGTDYQFFHKGEEGNHPDWDSKLFDYAKPGVCHFLLSNIKYWLEEYHFDGFRFDGVTSMIYKNHGRGVSFDNYSKYFSMNTDIEAINYLQMANELIREIKKDAITIAEDMSAMPGMCLPIKYGGIGFDYRLSMGMPDFWEKTLSIRDEDWDMGKMWYELSTYRPEEKRIAYVESHDQALVGSKTTIFRLADSAMYWEMEKDKHSIVIDRAIALHKMIRWITISMGADAYLNFMGNEFGHPEWIDFPREGNNYSYHYARRLWSLADNGLLKYEWLLNWDKRMLENIKDNNQLGNDIFRLWLDNDRKVIAYRNNDLVYIFNFHPQNSYDSFQVPIHDKGEFKVVLDTDDIEFGGLGRISKDYVYESKNLEHTDYDGIEIYLPSRTALALKKVK
ncbi:alpha amylase C-terminal domain-containing protein [Anaerococcus sp. AGMB00486]|uniref:1,4-alpha-glucan branching enzyme n=2 Tax=Anaerococcus TaxID=165779 RepID=A0ABX2NCU9_9FIRM|nr:MULTISPECIES: alpha-amylase family glycosyl hydrolase [Anaerococcus]MSS78594.1 1,4-alpha-glucan-branching enzyme [Anaerococcus porci]NVF12527.1 alpha amylase C-terminal domain-containing protein [Anaerococcus faecalis]